MNPSREPLPDRCPGQRSWHYDRAEIIADGSCAAASCIGAAMDIVNRTTAVKVRYIVSPFELSDVNALHPDAAEQRRAEHVGYPAEVRSALDQVSIARIVAADT